MKKAFIFPGQGSQFVGMGKDFYENFAVAKEVFDEVDEALKQNLSKLIFQGPIEELTLTSNTQPALMVVSLAIMKVLSKELKIDVSNYVDFVAGHSLGEYSALAAAGSITLTDTAKLLKIRGNAMQEAVASGSGAMAALLGTDFALAEAITKDASGVGVCEIANDNSVGQIVISGASNAIDRAIEIATATYGKKAIKLNVSAPFHCSLMQPAEEIMRGALATAIIKSPVVPIVCNVRADAISDAEHIRQALVEQITGMVRWRQTIEFFKESGVGSVIEIGAGKVLSGLVKRIDKEITTMNIGSCEDLDLLAE